MAASVGTARITIKPVIDLSDVEAALVDALADAVIEKLDKAGRLKKA